MSDMNKRAGSNDCDDGGESGERGEKGKHGKHGDRGPRGHDGHDGATGPTGPQGPRGSDSNTTGPTGSGGLTGPMGETGPDGSGGGLTAYGHAVNSGQSVQNVDPNSDVLFNLGGVGFPNVGITVPAVFGSAFKILSSGDYAYDFYVAAHNIDNPAKQALDFALAVNGVPQSPGHAAQSNHQVTATAADTMVVRGNGIITLSAGDTVSLQNRTASKLGLSPNATGSALACPNASLTLMKLSP